MSRSYYVQHERVHGFWVVALNDSGHYRAVARYSRQEAAVRAANTLNEQTDDTYGSAVLRAGAL